MPSAERFRRSSALLFRLSLDYLRRRPLLKRTVRPFLLPVLGLAYRRWVAAFDRLDDADRSAIRAHIARLPDPPLISVVMPAYQTPERLLRQAIASVQAQLWPHWELCVVDDASPSPHVAALAAAAAAADPRIRWLRRDTNGHICAATNSALALATGRWVALLDHDDILPEHALYEVAVEAVAHPDAQVIFSDEDHVDARGRRSEPYFKPDFDPDLLLGQNVVSHLGVYRRDLLLRLGGMRQGFEGSQDHDLALRAVAAAGEAAVRHIPRILYHWRQSAGQASFSEASLARCIDASRRAVRDHLAGDGLAGGGRPAMVAAAPLAPAFTRVVWPLPEPPPLVSVVVQMGDRSELLDRCVDGVLHRTAYPAIEVLVAHNGSTDPRTLALPARLAADPRVRVLPMPGPANLSRRNNRAAAEARGEVLLLLDNAIDVIGPDWLREMVSHCVRPAIGAVGCKLLDAEGRLRHGGTVLGLGGVAGHYLVGAPRGSPGPSGSLALVRSVSAVTAACLAVRREVFEAVGGFDEQNLPATFNDVDLCLRIREAGWRNLWTPFAELHQLGSASQGDDLGGETLERLTREEAHMRRRWGRHLAADPYWNPNLSLVTPDRSLAAPPRGRKAWLDAVAGMTP